MSANLLASIFVGYQFGRRTSLVLCWFVLAFFGSCNWAVQPEIPVYSGKTLPLAVGVVVVDNVGNKYGQKVVESLETSAVFQSVQYPYRGNGSDVDAVLTLTISALDSSGAVVASNLLLGVTTLGLAGQGTASKNSLKAELRKVNGWSKTYEVEVDSYFHRRTGMRKEQIEQRSRYLQTSKLAYALAQKLESDRELLNLR